MLAASRCAVRSTTTTSRADSLTFRGIGSSATPVPFVVAQKQSLFLGKGRMRRSESLKALLARAAKQYADSLSPKALSFLSDHGISEATARRAQLGVVASPLPGHELYKDRLAIPYLTKTGVVNMRFRCLDHEDCRTVGCPKYLSLPGAGLNLFHTAAFWSADNEIAVCEGELDALTNSYEVGVPSVGVPGVETWEDYYDRLFHGYQYVWVFADGDSAGRDFAKSLLGRLPNAISVPVPGGQDLSSWVVRDGWESVTDILDELRSDS